MQPPPDTVPDPPVVRVRARTVSLERPTQRRNSSPNMGLPLLDEEVRAPPKGIKPNHPLSKSMVNPNGAEADSIRERFRKAQTLAILEGLDHGAAGRAAWLGKRRLVFWLSATALLSGTVAQLCNELIFRADPEAGDTVSLVEYGTAAILSAGALRHPRRLPWRCHAILFAAGLLYSKLMNAGLAVRCLPMPLVLVMKNANILANMAVGCAAGKRYSLRQLAAAAVLTAGLVLSALGGRQEGGGIGGGGSGNGSSGDGSGDGSSDGEGGEGESSSIVVVVSDGSGDGGGLAFAFGVLCLGGALLARATGGVAQERAFEQHGIHCGEVRLLPPALTAATLTTAALTMATLTMAALSYYGHTYHGCTYHGCTYYGHTYHGCTYHGYTYCGKVMFYRAALGLPFFAWGAVFTGGGALSLGGASASVSAAASAPAAAAVVAVAGVAVPRLYLLLAGNVVGDYCCKVSMTRLVGEASALAATMVITLQRFASLVFSATVLSPAYPPAGLWAGISLVALGSVGYLGSPARSGGTRSQDPGRSEVQAQGKKKHL